MGDLIKRNAERFLLIRKKGIECKVLAEVSLSTIFFVHVSMHVLMFEHGKSEYDTVEGRNSHKHNGRVRHFTK